MRATIYPGKLQGTIRVPSSPALTQRAILGACLCDSHTLIQAECADAQTLALEGVLAEAGFPVAHEDLIEEKDSNGILRNSCGCCLKKGGE